MLMKKILTKLTGIFINITAVFFPKWSKEFTFRLFCKVPPMRFSEKGKQFIATAKTSFLEVDGHSAVLHRWGTGPKKVLFLHGWMSHSQRWAPYINKLDLKQYTVYAIDAPGHGLSSGKHLNLEIYRKAAVRAIEKSGAIDTLITHSLGGLVAVYGYLHDQKIPVNRYIIMGAPSGMDAIFNYFKTLLGLSDRAMCDLEEKANSILKVPLQEIYMEQFFRKVKKPVLVIHDKGDVITPFNPIEKALQQNSTIETFFTEGLHHDLKSEAVYETVINFIENKSLKMTTSQSA